MRVRVVSFDLDGTLIHPAVFNAVADALGFGEPLQRSYEAYLKGEMTLEEAFHQDFQFFVGRRVSAMRDALTASDRWTPGIAEAVNVLHDAGVRVVLTTDQPQFLAEHVLDAFGFDGLVCTPTRVGQDGCVLADIDPRFEKWPNLKRYLDARGVAPEHVAHVGNGRNDIPVFQQVGVGVAVNAEHPAVANAATHVIPRLADARDVVTLILD